MGMILFYYLAGSFLAFMTVLTDYSERYPKNVDIKQINKDCPEACIVFWAASLLSWVYVLTYFIYRTYLFIKEKL